MTKGEVNKIFMYILVGNKDCVNGTITVPGDKSISHRAIMFGSIADGMSHIENISLGKDCLSTIDCMRNLGVSIELIGKSVNINGKGLFLKKSPKTLNVGNSGTTIRLLMGILAGQKFRTQLTGDESIKKRPMRRVIIPLTMMGALIYAHADNFAPITITGNNLKGIDYRTEVSSAQLKSSIMLASLYADGKTTIEEPYKSRNHTELMLNYFGGNCKVVDNKIICTPVNKLYGREIKVPGDISSASYFIIAACILPHSEILIKDVNVNPTRTGIIDVIKGMGGNIYLDNLKKINNEPIADIVVKSSNLKGTIIEGEMIPRLIDEIPVIAVAAAYANGKTIIKDAEELKIKESNRIEAIVTELKKMGADIISTNDGMIINGKESLKGATLECYNDHRIAMSLSIAALKAKGTSKIKNASCVNISYPDFYNVLSMI